MVQSRTRIGIARGWASALVLMALLPWTARAATPKEIDDAIGQLKTEIYAGQKNGNWEVPQFKNTFQEGGDTALAVYALLASGENPQDPRIQQAIAYLKKCPMQGTYALGLRCQVWLNLPRPYPKDIKDALSRDAQTLLALIRPCPAVHGPNAFYNYTPTDAHKEPDPSNSQYAVLGIWACAEASIEIPMSFWRSVDSGWRAIQQHDGGWSYIMPAAPGRRSVVPPSASMTAAGVATLFISQGYVHGMDGVDCHGNSSDPNIDAGLEWMGKNFQSIYTGLSPPYALYGVSRIGAASGRKYLGSVDWFKEGAAYILKKRANPDPQYVDPNPQINLVLQAFKVRDDAFELLFLSRGRAPVVINKLQYELNMHGDKPREANWNQRPRDAANISQWISRENEHYLNWQVVDLKTSLDQLHDAPILYIAGNQALDFSDEQLAKLRQFVLEGGLIFANADCANVGFVRSMHQICQKLFPDYAFRDLPADSPIYLHEQYPSKGWKNKPKVEALSNGAREWVILCPTGDPARFWQTQTYGGHEELHQLMDDIALYVANRGEAWTRMNRGETYIARPDASIQTAKTISLARLHYPGNWDPEPAGWTRLAAILHNTQNIQLQCTAVPLGQGKLDASFKVAHLTGTTAFTLPPEARQEIAKYIEAGGTLIVDSCGGHDKFTQAAQAELAAIFPATPLPADPLPPDHPAFSLGPPLEKFEYRAFAHQTVGNLTTPRLRALTINGRPAVFFSAEDLSCGIVGMPVDGIYGYDPASATALVEKLVLFANR